MSRICFSETLQEIGVSSLGKNLYFFLVGSLSTIIVIITLISLTDTNILRLQTAKVSFLVSAFLAFCSFYLDMWLSTEFPLYTSKIRSDMLSCFRINSVNPYHFLFWSVYLKTFLVVLFLFFSIVFLLSLFYTFIVIIFFLLMARDLCAPFCYHVYQFEIFELFVCLKK